jgi:hypothetical protein
VRGPLSPVLFRPPRGTTLGRACLVCVLLLCAAALLSQSPPPCPVLSAPAPVAPSPAPTNPSAPPEVPPGLVGVAVPLAEPAAAFVLRPGARVDLIGVGERGPALTGALLLRADADAALLVAVSPSQAVRLVNAPIGAVYRVMVRG